MPGQKSFIGNKFPGFYQAIWINTLLYLHTVYFIYLYTLHVTKQLVYSQQGLYHVVFYQNIMTTRAGNTLFHIIICTIGKYPGFVPLLFSIKVKTTKIPYMNFSISCIHSLCKLHIYIYSYNLFKVVDKNIAS